MVHSLFVNIHREKSFLPVLMAFLGITIGVLHGQFAWALITAVGLTAFAYVAKNLADIFPAHKICCRRNDTGASGRCGI